MSKIKFKLYNEDRFVIFRILEQCPSITCKHSTSPYEYLAKNGITISSCVQPELYYENVFIKGSESDWDDRLIYIPFSDEAEAKKHIKRVLEAFEEWKQNGYFNNTDEYEEQEEELNTYSF